MTAFYNLVGVVAGLLLPLIGFTILAWKTKYPVFFQICFGLGFVAAFQWYDAFGTHYGLAVSIGLIIYALVCAGAAFTGMFNAPRGSE